LPFAAAPAYVTLLPLSAPVYDALPSEHLKFVLQPVCVTTQASAPHVPRVVHVPAMLSHAALGAPASSTGGAFAVAAPVAVAAAAFCVGLVPVAVAVVVAVVVMVAVGVAVTLVAEGVVAADASSPPIAWLFKS
jgi:hypothetical protein